MTTRFRGREERPQRGDDGKMVTLVDVRHVLLCRLDRERDLHRAAFEGAADREASLFEDAQHGSVVRNDLSHETLDADASRARHEPLQETGADASPLMGVGDGECHLGRCWIAQPHVARKRDDRLGTAVVGKRADQVAVVRPVRVEKGIDERRADRRGAVEAAIEAVLGQRGEEIKNGSFIGC